MFLVVLVVFAYWFSLFLVGPQGALPTISFDFHKICSFLVALMVPARTKRHSSTRCRPPPSEEAAPSADAIAL